MKLLAILLLAAAGAALLWVGLSAPAADYVPPREPERVPVALAGEVPAGCQVVTLDVTGMCCSGCSAKLYRALVEAEGVREAAVDPTTGRAQVVVPQGTPAEGLARLLTFDEYVATARP
jgi:copper chaperone CopZ